MLGYACVKCNRELLVEKNDVPLIHFMNNDRKQGVDAVRFGDIWYCPNCNLRVMLGMGGQITGFDLINPEKFLKDHHDFVEVKRQ